MGRLYMRDKIVFTFPDGETRTFPLYALIRGMRNRSGRPIKADITSENVSSRLYEYINRNVILVLAPKHELNITVNGFVLGVDNA